MEIETIPLAQSRKDHRLMSNEDKINLWLDKYRAEKYDDLLTDEKSNREILTWMKSWDEVVFKKKKKKNFINDVFFGSHKNDRFDNHSNKQSFLQNNQFSANKFKVSEIDLTCNKYKIIVISGPPGIGKTTLAKVVANHCGYEPLIINASDERTPEKLFQKIFDSTQIHNLSFNKEKKSKPSCLILDEIDGITEGVEGKTSINSIMEFIKTGKIPQNFKNSFKMKKGISSLTDTTSQPFNEHEKNDQDKDENMSDDENHENNLITNKNQKSGKQKNSIKRPIICICNDIYAKALKNLRKESLRFNLKRGNNAKLRERLKKICAIEKIYIDNNTIDNLIEKSNYDIRICVNTLQFISYNMANPNLINSLSQNEVSVLNSKDVGLNIFEIWNSLFTSPTTKTPNFKEISHLYFSHGNFDIINDGLYVNYLKIQSKENDLENKSKILDYLSYSDVISQKIVSHQLFEMMPFQCLPGLFAKNRFSVSEKEKLNLEFPTFLIELKKNQKLNSKIIASLKESFEEERKCENFIKKKNFIQEYLPYLYEFIQPNIREINTELLNPKEKKQLKISLSLMNELGVKFTSDDSEDSPFYEPDLKSILNFQLSNSRSYHRLTSRLKLIISSEFETFKTMKEAQKQFAETTINGPEKTKENDNSNSKGSNILNNNKMNLLSKRKSNYNAIEDYKFIYKYNEGVTNKVTKSMNINYFIN